MNVFIFLYDDFNALDVFGPAQVFGALPDQFHIQYVSPKGGIVNSTQDAKIWTEPLEADAVNGIFLLPGGRGARKLQMLEPEVLPLIKTAAENSDYCLMIGNGSALLCQTGLLYRREIADYPGEENWKRMFSAEIIRIPMMRWISDGKYYSSSASVYGIDMSLGLIEDIVDIEAAEKIAGVIGYRWDEESREGYL